MRSTYIVKVSCIVVCSVARCALADVVAYDSDATIASNMVLAADSQIAVSASADVTTVGTLAMEGPLTKTGTGGFELKTSISNGKTNGGPSAELSVAEGTFSVATATSVANSFSAGLAIGLNGVFEQKSGKVTTDSLNLDGGSLAISGGSLTSEAATGIATIGLSGDSTLTVNGTYQATNGTTRIDVGDGSVFAVKDFEAADGADVAIHVDGGTVKSLQSVFGDSFAGGTVYVGEGGMTIDISDTHAWGPAWSMDIAPETGVSDGGIAIVSSAGTPTDPMRIRFAPECAMSIIGGVRIENAEVMLLGSRYPVSFTVGERSGVRAAVSPSVTVDALNYSGSEGYLIVGVSSDTGVTTLLTANEFTPPSKSLRLKFIDDSSTSALYPAGTADFLKIPASVELPLSRLALAQNRGGYMFTFSERIEGDWRIISVLSEEYADTALDVHKTDEWMTGTTPWRLNNTVYEYTGGDRTVDALMIVNPASYRRNAMLAIPDENSLVLTGGSQQMQGGFVKFGDGTLTFGGSSSYFFSHNFAKLIPLEKGETTLSITNASGVSTRTHDASLTVAAGTLRIGTGSDSPVVTVDFGEVDVGTATTATSGAERDAAMVVESGHLSVLTDPLVVGRTHGIVSTQSHTPLDSSFTQNGGSVVVDSVGVAIDELEKSSMNAKMTVKDGTFVCRREMRLGMTGTSAAAASTATLEVNGGTLDVGEEAVSLGLEGRLLAGTNSSSTLSTVLSINGGTTTLHGGAYFSKGGSHAINLNDGGVLAVKDSFTAASGADTTINWNGGVVKFLGSVTMSGFSTVNVGEKDAIIDLSDADVTSWFNQALTGEGRLVVRGSGYTNGVQIYGAYQGCAGVVVEAGGNAILRVNPTEGCPVLVKNGGAVTAYYGRTYPNLTLGESETDVTTLLGYKIGDSLSYITVNGTFAVNGTVYVGARETSQGRLVLPEGDVVLLRAPKGQIDVSKFQIHPDLVARGAVGELWLDESGSTYDVLTVTCTSDPSEYVWTAGTSGSWETAGNWSVQPANAADDKIIFPSDIAEDITVTTSGARMREISNNSAQEVKISGPVVFSSYAIYDIPDGDGVLEIDGTLSTATQVSSKRTSGAGTLRIGGQMSGAADFFVNSGRIEGDPSLFGYPKMNLSNTTLRFTESGTYYGSILHEDADAKGVGIDVAEGKVVYATGELNNSSALQKTGPGEVVFCRTGTKASVTNFVGKTEKEAEKVPYVNGTNGDVPNGPPLGIYAGTIAFDGNDNTRYAVDGAVWVGFHPIADGAGGAYDANLDVRGGVLTVGSLIVSRLVDADYDAVDKLGFTKSPRCAVNVSGGTLRVLGSFIFNYPYYVSSSICELNISGGLVETLGTKDTSSFGIGYHDSNVVVSPEELSTTINISGDGILRRVGTTKLCFGGYGGGRKYIQNIALNMTGGRFEAPDADLDLMNRNAKVAVNLCGGVLEVKSLKQTKSIGSNGSCMNFHFSGGTYRPTSAESTFPARAMTSFTVGEGGAIFDLCDTNKLTLAQALVTADGVAKDGGISLTATSNAVLTLEVANGFNGPITVNGGTVKPAVAGAAGCAEGVVVNGDGVFDASGMDFSFGYVRGSGTYANGSLTVTGDVAPGGSSLTVGGDLVLGDGAVLNCPVSGNAESGWTAPCVVVGGNVTALGTVSINLGHDVTDPLPVGCAVKIAEVPTGALFPVVDVVGIGSVRRVARLYRVTREADGVDEIWLAVDRIGLSILLR